MRNKYKRFLRFSSYYKEVGSEIDKLVGVCQHCGEHKNLQGRSIFDYIYKKKFCYSCDSWTELIEARHFGKTEDDFDEYGELLPKFDIHTGKLKK